MCVFSCFTCSVSLAIKLAKDQVEDSPYGAPAEASMSDAEKQENAAVALNAMAAAIDAGESKSELNQVEHLFCTTKKELKFYLLNQVD